MPYLQTKYVAELLVTEALRRAGLALRHAAGGRAGRLRLFAQASPAGPAPIMAMC